MYGHNPFLYYFFLLLLLLLLLLFNRFWWCELFQEFTRLQLFLNDCVSRKPRPESRRLFLNRHQLIYFFFLNSNSPSCQFLVNNPNPYNKLTNFSLLHKPQLVYVISVLIVCLMTHLRRANHLDKEKKAVTRCLQFKKICNVILINYIISSKPISLK